MIAAAPYIAAAWLLSIGGAGWYGMNLGEDRVAAKTAELNKLVQEVEARAMLGAANAIAKNKPLHTTIQSKVETITREVPVYRDCVTTPDVVGLLDTARANGKQQGVSGGSVPGTGARVP